MNANKNQKWHQNMKRMAKVCAGLLVVAVWVFFHARADYSWSEKIIEKKTAEGWTLAATQDNFGDLVRPWTWFKTPVTGLWFIRQQESRRFRSVIAVPVLRVSYDYSKTEQEEHVEFFDIAEGRSAILVEDMPIEKVVLSQLEWVAYPPGTPGDKLIKYMQEVR
ncbi:MAG: hypothetical protein C4532_03275 [Candidatus Abyssobacteria bacterium SURF_17]|uniref:Uncharacterized protein n=1 Tax=Candidatus Abyssobacteria bacterium SURF_17 TaxID=2093361 RepID=A0A419F6D5_9BACT|nr:MAG: hypothetical protein C4532_03275 [Candidatus Abyssubacteria bacterium SURF_17]